MTSPELTPSPAMEPEFAERTERLRTRMSDLGLDAVALTSPENIYYHSGLDHLGYFSFTLLLVPRDGVPTLVTRAMETPTVREQLPWVRHLPFTDATGPAPAVAAAVAAVPTTGVVGVERGGMFLPPLVEESIAAAVPGGARLRDVTWAVGDQRTVQSATEVALTRRAARLSDRGLRAALDTVAPGARDHDLAANAVHAMISGGGQTPGFAPLVRPLHRLDQEHVSWTGRELVPGEGVFVELSGCVGRYHAPLSRTVYLGDPPDGAERAHDASLAGLRAAREVLRPGVPAATVYATWQRAVTRRTGPPTRLRHHCGYLVGIGYPPSWVGGGAVRGIRSDSPTRIRAGMVLHLMSWVTEPAGHVTSDTVLVTDDGCEVLTSTPRDLTVLPA